MVTKSKVRKSNKTEPVSILVSETSIVIEPIGYVDQSDPEYIKKIESNFSRATSQNLQHIAAIKEVALENYDKGGDLVIETMTDAEIFNEMARHKYGLNRTIKAMKELWSSYDSYREDIRNS